MFTYLPLNLDSLYSDLLYLYESSESADLDFYINNVAEDYTIGVKKFYSTTYAMMNIASIVRPAVYPTPKLREQGFIDTDEIGLARVTVRCGDTTTAERQFTLSRQRENSVGLVSALPSQRFISVGEVDVVRFVVDPTARLYVDVTYTIADDNLDARKPYIDSERAVESFTRSEVTHSTDPDGCYVVDFQFVAHLINDDWSQSDSYNLQMCESVSVVARQSDVEIGRVEYSVIPKPDGAMRLAWLSDRGTIEHYTFPVVKSYSVDSSFQKSYTLTSAYESFEVRCALAQIAGAKRLWVATEESSSMSYSEAQSEDSVIEVSQSRELATVDVKITVND